MTMARRSRNETCGAAAAGAVLAYGTPAPRGVTPQTAATRDLGSGDSADHMKMDQIVSQPSSHLLKDI